MRTSKKIYRQLLNIAVCGFMVFNLLTVNTFAQESGTCGNNVSWNFSNGILKIEGNGKMNDYNDPSSVPWYSFKEQIVNVIIENDVDNIGNIAFYDCNNLGSVVIGNGVTTIGTSAFLECEKLTNVRLGSNVKRINQAAFKMCTSLQSIILSQGLEFIGHEAFFLCQSLKSITIPSSVTHLGESVFAYCSNLLQVNFNAKLDKLPDWTFYDCESLANITLPETITEVGQDAFEGCDRLDIVDGTINNNQTDEHLDEQTNNETNIDSNEKTNNDTTILLPGKPNNIQQDVIENEDVVINGSITDTNITIDATVSDKEGWQQIIDKVTDFQVVQDTMEYETPIDVNVLVYNDLKVSGDLLESLAGSNTILVIRNGNIEIQINCKDLVIGKKYKDFKLDYTLEKVTNYTKAITKAIGDADAYYLKIKANIDFNVTLKILLGAEHDLSIAALYEKDGGDWEVLQSVTTDSLGYASFYLGSFDSFTKYLIGINVEGIDSGIIPDDLYDNYEGLMDAYGNRYVITGRTSKWGITAGQLTIILIVFMVVITASIGGVMYMIHKRKQAKEKIRKEVMGDLDD